MSLSARSFDISLCPQIGGFHSTDDFSALFDGMDCPELVGLGLDLGTQRAPDNKVVKSGPWTAPLSPTSVLYNTSSSGSHGEELSMADGPSGGHQCATVFPTQRCPEPPAAKAAPPPGKRKVGRPIAYEGDPNAPHLTMAERRRMRRRIANRESARRVRAKVLNDIVQVQMRAQQLEQINAQLSAEMVKMESQTAQLHGKQLEIEECERGMMAENQRLEANIVKTRAAVLELEQKPGIYYKSQHLVNSQAAVPLPMPEPWSAQDAPYPLPDALMNADSGLLPAFSIPSMSEALCFA